MKRVTLLLTAAALLAATPAAAREYNLTARASSHDQSLAVETPVQVRGVTFDAGAEAFRSHGVDGAGVRASRALPLERGFSLRPHVGAALARGDNDDGVVLSAGLGVERRLDDRWTAGADYTIRRSDAPLEDCDEDFSEATIGLTLRRRL